mmetsp:Transcript_27569/g.82538  ORF Transcript_27569/g.82538 Transcript_27569/m.82538 type:complete len:584 (-) Transcript_27569:32-1783(-)
MAKADLMDVNITADENFADDGAEDAAPRTNPCEALTNFAQNHGEILETTKALASRLSAAAGKLRGAFAAPTLGRDYSSVEVLEVTVKASEGGSYELKTRARFEGCAVDLTIAGSSLTRAPRDLDWLRGCLRDEYPGCVVPPLTADVYASPGSAEAVERFLAQCLAHPELARAPELACLCASDATELADARASFAAARASSPVHVRLGALVLDVVGNDTAVGQELLDDAPAALAAAKRREADVRELYTWARAQAYEIGRAEREATRGADALRQFEEAAGRTKAALASRFNRDGPQVGEVSADSATSGPATSLAALREMVGLARALAEAVESRDRVRLQYVCATNALKLARQSRRAREALAEASEAQAERAARLRATADAIDTSGPPSADDPPAPTLAQAEETVRAAAAAAEEAPASPETDAPAEEDYKVKALALYGAFRDTVVTYAAKGVEIVKDGKLLEKVPDRERVKALATKGATLAASLGLKVASLAATGSAKLQSDADTVASAEKLVRDLADAFDAADARLRADALKLKSTWDDLQLQAYDAFVRGEASRADTARAAADGAALSLVHMKHETDAEGGAEA